MSLKIDKISQSVHPNEEELNIAPDENGYPIIFFLISA